LTYGSCVFVGGLAQCYSLRIPQDPQEFGDAIYFFQQLSLRPPFPKVGLEGEAPMALAVWQQAYTAAWALDLSPGLSLGVIVNALTMGLTAAVTVATARQLFGDDSWRLRRVGMLFASCGLFLLFGSVLLRDCFVLLLNTIWLWAAVRWIVRPSTATLSLAVLVGIAAPALMPLLRPEAVPLFFVNGLIAALSWYGTRRLNGARVAVVVFAFIALLIVIPQALELRQTLQDVQAESIEKYNQVSQAESSEKSLGMRFIISQPLPVRLFTGNVLLLVGQIPLWANFSLNTGAYHWIRGYQTLYQLIVVPLAATGIFLVLRLLRTRGRRAVPWLFLLGCLVASDAAVVVTSLEARHLAASTTAFVILAALPNTRDGCQRRDYHVICAAWFAMVCGVYLAWGVLKGLA